MPVPKNRVGQRLENDERAALARVLKELRDRQRFSQEELALRAQMSTAGIAKIERAGSLAEPDTLRRIAQALADTHPEDAPEYFRQLMEAAGHLIGLPDQSGRSGQPDWARSKPPIPIITRGIRDHPDIPAHLQRAITEILEATEEINRQAKEGGG